MLPTLKPKQDILIWCWFNKYRVGDIVAIHMNGRDIIKRVEKIRKSEYFVAGDNKKESTDSRKFGWIEKEKIIGKAIFY